MGEPITKPGIRAAAVVNPEFAPGNRIEPGPAAHVMSNELQMPFARDPYGVESTTMQQKPSASAHDRPDLRIFPVQPQPYGVARNEAVNPSSQATATTDDVHVPDSAQVRGSEDGVPNAPKYGYVPTRFNGIVRGATDGSLPLTTQDKHLATPAVVSGGARVLSSPYDSETEKSYGRSRAALAAEAAMRRKKPKD